MKDEKKYRVVRSLKRLGLVYESDPYPLHEAERLAQLMRDSCAPGMTIEIRIDN